MAERIEQWHHDNTPVARPPLPEELEHPSCMTGRRLRTARRLVRQLSPRPGTRDCCQYHRQDWSHASETAVRLLRTAQSEGLSGEGAAGLVTELAEAEGLSQTVVEAIHCLVSTTDPLMLDDEGGIYGGRHRIQG